MTKGEQLAMRVRHIAGESMPRDRHSITPADAERWAAALAEKKYAPATTGKDQIRAVTSWVNVTVLHFSGYSCPGCSVRFDDPDKFNGRLVIHTGTNLPNVVKEDVACLKRDKP